jgi:hypothetical protein
MAKFTIAVKDISTDETVQTIGSSNSERGLERTERGVNINLNHADYYTEIVEVTSG